MVQSLLRAEMSSKFAETRFAYMGIHLQPANWLLVSGAALRMLEFKSFHSIQEPSSWHKDYAVVEMK
tara:strand:- start:212 stop:412 length:201 start_codon:yes stop_codon:yes gene_type:complete